MNVSIAQEEAHSQTRPEPPCFVRSGPGFYDGWSPQEHDRTPDDPVMEGIVGEFYADLAVKYARQVGQHAFISMVMTAIFYKTAHGFIRMGELEQGFLRRIAQLSYLASLD
jgi:hypothetical protein